MKRIAGWMKRFGAWWKRIVREMAHNDPKSWFSHWTLVTISTALPAAVVMATAGALVGIVAGFALSEAWFAFFVGREVSDYIRHQSRGDDMRRYTWDGILDLAGPLIWHLLMWLALIHQIFKVRI